MAGESHMGNGLGVPEQREGGPGEPATGAPCLGPVSGGEGLPLLEAQLRRVREESIQ